MAFWDRVRQLLRREQNELKDAVRDFESRADAALDKRERELHASPEEKLELQQERAREADEEFEAVRRRIEGGGG